MSCSFSLHVPKALPLLPSSSRGISSLFIASKHKPSHNNNTPSQSLHHILKCSCSEKPNDDVIGLKKPSLALHVGAVLLALAEHPALAVTGENNPQELTWVLTQLGIVLFFYFLVAPPIIMYWLWKRWYRRKLAEMYFQFMFVFIFFPAVIVWAPFLNFRKFPRDPSLQYPWSIPEDPSKIRNAYSKYPFAEPEDYDGCHGSDFCPYEVFKEMVAPHQKHDYDNVCNAKLEQKPLGSMFSQIFQWLFSLGKGDKYPKDEF